MEWWIAGMTFHVGMRDAVVVTVVVGAFILACASADG